MAQLTARDVMTADPLVVAPDVEVRAAAQLMSENNVGSLPVVDGDRVVGIVTEGDLIMQDVKLEYPTYIHLLDGFIMYPPSTARFESQLKKAVAAKVEDVMTKNPVTVQVDAPIEDVASLLADREVSRLPVLEGERLVGIVSKHDIVRAIARGL